MCVLFLCIIALCRAKDEGCGTNGDDVAIGEGDFLIIAQDVVHIEGACVGRGIPQDVLQLTALVALHADDAVFGVYARVNGFNGQVDIGTLDISSQHVVAHAEREYLLVVEDIFHHHYATALVFVCLLVQNLVLACIAHLACAHAYAKLLGTFRTLKYQLLASLVFCLVESNVTVTFRATYTLHVIKKLRGNRVGR